MNQSIKVFAPATIANVTCGFDILGLAIDQPGDEVEMYIKDTPGVALTEITGDKGLLPRDPKKNTVSAVVLDYLQKTGHSDIGVNIRLHKCMPIGSGLGSSAASTVAGLHAINQLMENPLPQKALLPFALAGEELACGQGHADNVAPALLGGFVLIRSYQPLDVIPLPTPEELVATVIHPQIEIQTRDARKILRKQVTLEDAVRQWGNIAGLISGLYRKDYDLLGRSMDDQLIEPSRAILIPEFAILKQKALEMGALGFGISGSGPSVFALSRGKETATQIQQALKQHLLTIDIESDTYISQVNTEGPKTLSSNF